MKLFKYYIFLLGSLFILLLSCASNGDDPDTPPIPPTDTIDINESDYIFGEWEVYYLTKGVNSYTPQREFFMDGFTINFNQSNSTYEQKNTLGEVNQKGTFEVINKNNIYLHHKGSRGQDTTTIFKVTTLTDKTMIRRNLYTVTNDNNRTFTVEDVQYLRHTERAPNETFDDFGLVKGKKITKSYLEGKWKLESMSVWRTNNGYTWNGPYKYEKENELLNTLFTFNFNSEVSDRHEGGYFTDMKAGNEQDVLKGEFIVIDDILHAYYYENNENGPIGRMAPLRLNIEIQNDKDGEYFEDVARTISYNTNGGFEIGDLQSLFYKPKSGW